MCPSLPSSLSETDEQLNKHHLSLYSSSNTHYGHQLKTLANIWYEDAHYQADDQDADGDAFKACFGHVIPHQVKAGGIALRKKEKILVMIIL